MGAQLVKEVATKTNDIAGDGTTNGHRAGASPRPPRVCATVAAGASPMSLKRGMEKLRSPRRSKALADQSVPRRRLDKDKIAVRWPPSPPPDVLESARRHRRGDRQGRQGRCGHRRGIPTPSAWISTSSRACSSTRASSRPTSSPTPSVRKPILDDALRPAATRARSRASRTCCPVLEKVMQSGKAVADHRRGHRGRGPRHPRGQQDPGHVQLGSP